MKLTRIALAAFWLVIPGYATAADIGELIPVCESCHGAQGASTQSDVPIIGGKSRAMVKKALEQFRSMDRPCRKSAFRHGDTTRPPTNMCRITEDLEDAEIDALSDHYSGLPFVAAVQDFNESLAIEGASLHSLYCESCHPKGGSEAGYAGRLAGQWTPYLRRTIGHIANSEMLVPHMMERKLSEFSDDEIDALLNFWASQRD